MKRFLGLAIASSLLAIAPVMAAEKWEAVTTNSVGDRFLVDVNSIEQRGESVWYWEYRDFKQPNNVFLDSPVNKPVFGAVIYRSVDCKAGTTRLRRLTAYDKNRQVIQKFDYGDRGRLANPVTGSSAKAVLDFVCARTAQTSQPTTPQS